MGANGNLFANLMPLDGTVIVELDLNNNGSLVSRYVASAAELATIDDFYDLAYNNDTGLFYSFFTFQGSTPTVRPVVRVRLCDCACAVVCVVSSESVVCRSGRTSLCRRR
jgi:hypothetical protein